ncbi:DUF2599 domain-containing protein [Microbacterium caowuchunii]|uniref:DUF2599 domain-containing protein n=1 Tax=Microbacterium caowuchunii TaxID=2614638 RepID=UPI001243E8C4|nr:DUF2599 domain-containing protein [Microbacterium caowuchunii]QEW00615.1 DUF2599 domain-containing protein [Microbacterium caowuchunii]
MRFKASAATLLAGTLVVLSVPTASFADNDSPDLIDELRVVAPDLAEAAAPEGVTASTVEDVTASVTSDTITIASEAGEFRLTAEDPGDGSTVDSVLLDDASALFAIRIESDIAPRAYDFTLDLPDNAIVDDIEDGGYMYLNASGEFIGGTAAPWARDAEGKDIPTWFTLEGNQLTQHVDLDAVADIVYPVIADPYQGSWLVESAYVTSQSGSDYVVRAVPTQFGRYSSGAAILSYHSADLRARLGSNASKVISTIENQFHCHVVYNYAGGGPTYDMESWRADVWWWLQAAVGCNP